MQRFEAVDGLRGLAIAWMTAYHFCFDLTHYGFLREDFYQAPFWTWQRTAIVSLFLACAGMGQAIAVAWGQTWARFWRRWRVVALCALLVSAGSYLMFPQSFIYFGVLHGIAVMLILVRSTVRFGAWMWLMGVLAICGTFIGAQALEHSALAAVFDARVLNWLGLITQKPITEDYVPLLPWLGAMWWGAAAGQSLMHRSPTWLSAPLPRVLRPLAWAGRWSLSYYMLHQPILIGLVLAFGLLTK